MDFKEYLMEDALSAIIDYRGKTPQKAENGIPTLSAKSVKNNYINYAECYYISEAEYKRFMVRGFPKKGDILLTTEAPMGMVARLDRDDIAIAQRLLTLRGKEGVLDNDYLLYLLQSPYGQGLLKAKETGTTVTGIKQAEFRRVVIKLPDIAVQKKVTSILNAIDSKISCNTKINDNLQQQAATLFKAWFVDFVPFEGAMPPNWTISTLGSVTEIGAGGDKPKKSSPVKTPSCPYPIYSNGINDYGLYGYTNEPKIKVESVTVSARGTIGYVCLRHIPYVPIVRLVTLIPNTNMLSAKYLYLYLRQLRISGTGTTQQQLTVPDFRKTEIIIPDKTTMDSFTETITPLFDQVWANENENAKLAEVRDALLPKLMSGEIDVSDIQL